MQLKEYEFQRTFVMDTSWFCAWCPGVKEGSWPTLSPGMCLFLLCLKEFGKKMSSGIIYLHSPFTCYLVPCGPYSILFGCWEKRQQRLSHNTRSYLLNKGLARCLWLLTYGLYPPRSISAVDIKRVWRELGFPCLFSSNGASHMAKPGAEVASKSRSLADMTLGRQPGTKMTE